MTLPYVFGRTTRLQIGNVRGFHRHGVDRFPLSDERLPSAGIAGRDINRFCVATDPMLADLANISACGSSVAGRSVKGRP